MLREIRIKKGLTQNELGKLLGVTEANISKYESKKITPPLQVFNKLCEVLKLNNKQRVELMKSFEKGE